MKINRSSFLEYFRTELWSKPNESLFSFLNKSIIVKHVHFAFSIGLLFLVSCGTPQSLPSSKEPVTRVIILDEGDTISEKELGGFTSWQCKDFVYGGRTLVEVGFFGDPNFKDFGFILYDGGNKGESTDYMRAGLNHRWDWGKNGGNYAFIVEPDGTGLYYDFTTVPDGETTTAKSVYKCYKK